MDTSIFTDKSKKPAEKDLEAALGKTYSLWQEIEDMVYQKYPGAVSEWNFPGQKYGWNYKIRDKKRAIIYLLPRDQFFKVAFVFGQKAFDAILESSISKKIKDELFSSTPYAEGRGIRIDVNNQKNMQDISRLIDMKLAF